MTHKVTGIPKRAKKSYKDDNKFSPICELTGPVDENDYISSCSHFDHCERKSVVWIYDKDMSPFCFGLCNTCYAYCYPTTKQWYRVVEISPDFSGKL